MGLQFFDTPISAGAIGKYVLLPGDPGRVATIADLLRSGNVVFSDHEHQLFTGFYGTTKVTVASTGIGGPPTALMVRKLARLGAQVFIRIGGAGAIQPGIQLGDLVIASGAVRDEGMGSVYLPLAFPAAADFDVVHALASSAAAREIPHHVGIVHSKDSFTSQVAPGSLPAAVSLQWQWESWISAGVLASEMEAASLFIAAHVENVKAGAVVLVRHSKDLTAKAVVEDFVPAVQTSLEAVQYLDRKRS